MPHVLPAPAAAKSSLWTVIPEMLTGPQRDWDGDQGLGSPLPRPAGQSSPDACIVEGVFIMPYVCRGRVGGGGLCTADSFHCGGNQTICGPYLQRAFNFIRDKGFAFMGQIQNNKNERITK